MDNFPRHYRLDGVMVLPLGGEFDIGNSARLEEEINAALDGSDVPLVLDLSATDYVDSTVLAVLVRARNRAGERLIIVVPPASRVRRIFDVTGLATGLGVREAFEL